jgi:type II secretory pathway pseudopilin PulG
MIDVLVTISVVAVLISLLMPTLAGVKETARRVVCSSNVRQFGIGISMYADDHQAWLVPSVFRRFTPLPPGGSGRPSQPQDMMTVRAKPSDIGLPPSSPDIWDGLGILYDADYLRAAKLFYCPSHSGEHPFDRYSDRWGHSEAGEIVGNYHYRGIGPGTDSVSQRFLDKIQPQCVLVADGLRTFADFNHKVGSNILRADLSALWVPAPPDWIQRWIPIDESGVDASKVEQAWTGLDGMSGDH